MDGNPSTRAYISSYNVIELRLFLAKNIFAPYSIKHTKRAQFY